MIETEFLEYAMQSWSDVGNYSGFYYVVASIFLFIIPEP